jgi:hypothetical protein
MINQFLPCYASELRLGDIIYDAEVKKIVKIWHDVRDGENVVCINTDTPSDSKSRTYGCDSTFVSSVRVINNPSAVTTVMPNDYRVYRLLQLSKEQIEKIQDCPLLPI